MCCVTDEEIEEIASKTERFTGADLVQLCDSAEVSETWSVHRNECCLL